MDTSKIRLLVHTLKHLHYKQIYYRGFYFIRNQFFNKEYKKTLEKETEFLNWTNLIQYTDSYKKKNAFVFLNLKITFASEIDWNYNTLGKLWTYNLNYFDFLNQQNCSLEEGVNLIRDYIDEDDHLKDGKEPYPISLRGINWIKFLSKHSISDKHINQALYNHYQILLHNLEYHLLGNHLLENGFSLFFGAYYFKDEVLYQKAKKILKKELEEQILEDGAHFELSPMYHQILLHRLLDCIKLANHNPWKEDNLYLFLNAKAEKMLGWLKTITYCNGNIPMVNDCAYDIAPTSKQIFNYAQFLKIQFKKTILGESGYRKFFRDNYELFVDVGNVGPDYQPGHAHSDTFSFELYIEKRPFIVDVGISTYQKDEKRLRERQTFSHNTVMVNNIDQTDVWDGFRVGRRAKIINLKESPNMVSAAHDGYKPIGVIHERSFNATEKIIIFDQVSSKKNKNIKSQAFFHIHPSINRIDINNKQVSFDEVKASLNFEGEISNIELLEYEYCLGFNKTETAQKVCVSFIKKLKTTVFL